MVGSLIEVAYYVGGTSAAGAASLTVLQANLRLGSADPDAVVRLVQAQHVDLLATEELTVSEEQRMLAAGIGRLLPHRFTSPGAGGSGEGIWSRFPLTDERSDPGFELGVLHARVVAPSGSLIFAVVHLLP